MKKNFNPKKWDELVDELQKDYTISIRKVCQLLNCNRDWVNTYVRSNVQDCIELSRFWAIQYSHDRLAPSDQSAVWFRTTEFETFIKNSVTRVERRTRRLPIDPLIIDKTKLDDLAFTISRMKIEANVYKSKGQYSHAKATLGEINGLLFENTLPIVTKMMLDARETWNEQKRTDAPYVECPGDITFPDAIYRFDTVHGMVSTGGTNEMIYRRLYRDGAIKITINPGGKRGDLGADLNGQKIFYCTPTDDETPKLGHFDVPEFIYQKYRDQIYPS